MWVSGLCGFRCDTGVDCGCGSVGLLFYFFLFSFFFLVGCRCRSCCIVEAGGVDLERDGGCDGSCVGCVRSVREMTVLKK